MSFLDSISMTVMTEPQFQPENIEPQPSHDKSDPSSDPRLFQFERAGVSKAHAKIMREIRYMTYEVALHWPSNSAPTYCSDVLVRLLGLPPPVEEGPLVASVSECCRIATTVLLFLPFINDYPNPTLMINVQLHKLKAALENLLLFAPLNSLLPWLLGVGGIYAAEPERSWFVGQLLIVASDLDIKSWEDFRPHLVKVIWVEFFCASPFRELWDEVATRRDNLQLVDLDPW